MNKICTRIISFLLVVAMLTVSLPLAIIGAHAEDAVETLAETIENTKEAIENKKDNMTLAQSIEKTMSERKGITKDRSSIPTEAEAAVYVDNVLMHSGGFKDMWQKTLSLAPKIDKKTTQAQLDAMPVVEFVLNKDVRIDEDWEDAKNFRDGAMYIAHQKVTIDLNGHILNGADGGWHADSVIWINDRSVITIMDSNPTASHMGKVEGHKWKPDSKGSVELKGGVITGGEAASRGGGLFIEGDSTVYILGGNIAGNEATAGSGIFLDGGCYLDMSRGTSAVCYNACQGSTQDGGAVYISGQGPILKGGYIHHNWSEDYGAGIMADDDTFIIDGVTVYANKASEEGGGIYVGHELGAISKIMNCLVVGNYSGERGGGIYLYSYENELAIIDTTVEYNYSKEHGGGICVGDYWGADLTISGKIIVRNNHKSSEKNIATADDNSNLYLQGNEDLIVGELSKGSEIWLRTGTKAEDHNGRGKPITEGRTSQFPRYFHSDNEDFYIAYNEDPTHKNFHRYYFVKYEKDAKGEKILPDPYNELAEMKYSDSRPVKTGTLYEATTADGKKEKFPVYRGTLEYNLMTTSDFVTASPFYYSDGYFFNNPEKYDTHLATMSINMAVAAFGRATNAVAGNKYALHFANVKQLMADIGCDDEYFFANTDYQMKPSYYGEEGRLSTIGMAMSQKEISMDGETYTLIPVAIRGGGYEVEWASNVTIGHEGEAEGFADAANQVTRHIQDYIEKYDLTERLEEGRVKFWVVGYSRAGATANLTSKRLVDAYGALGNDVYGYTFEAPMGGRPELLPEVPEDEEEETETSAETDSKEEDKKEKNPYPTIHNTINENDFVTLVAPGEMGFIRYGVDHLIGANHQGKQGVDSSAYLERRQKMLRQLLAINPYYSIDDSWQVADVNVILGSIPYFGTDYIDKGKQIWDDPNWQCYDIYDFLRWFFYQVQVDGLVLPDGKDGKPDLSLAREYYSSVQHLMNIEGNNKTSVSYDDPTYNFGYSSMTIEEAVCGLMKLLQGPKSDQLMGILMGNASVVKSDLKSFGAAQYVTSAMAGLSFGVVAFAAVSLVNLPLAAVAGFISALTIGIVFLVSDLLDLYNDLLSGWDENSAQYNAQSLNNLVHMILNTDNGGDSIWSVLNDEEKKLVAEGVPVILWFLLNYASRDYNENMNFTDDGMWGVGTFVNNMSHIISQHYQEVSVAWVRSCDDYYAKDVQAYALEKFVPEAPVMTYTPETNVMTLKADAGSCIFYSIDGGTSWTLYTESVQFDKEPEEVLAYTVCRGNMSEPKPIPKNYWTGSILGEGRIWVVIAGAVLITVGAVVSVEYSRAKKKKENA